jgi:hypothetical protein
MAESGHEPPGRELSLEGLSPFGVRATSGSLRDREGITLPHPWTEEGVAVWPASNGAQVLHLSVALCVLNDTYREAQRRGIRLDGVAVTADGGFDDFWASTGITYTISIDAAGAPEVLHDMLEAVDQSAEIPKVLRAGAKVTRG